MTITRIAQPGRLGQPWVREIVPGVFRVGTTFSGCYAVEDAGAYTFIDVGPGQLVMAGLRRSGGSSAVARLSESHRLKSAALQLR